MIVSIFQNDLSKDFLHNSFGQNSFFVWLAPSEGLLLKQILLKGYNSKKDIPEKVELSQEELMETNDFQIEKIYSSIIQE